ncbi:MAG: Rrf2 family transcriptional regulator [Clostridiaceae bacterium]|nr:Rrf2 family transcriptional regulator [Clostridiaceae bacterium]MCI9484719.1 Rrf2 family transcriptional regulator [Clostridiaceae bacterium]NBH78727.1 Rrf2 family transcriptional regulator [Clostridiaceae bacterium]
MHISTKCSIAIHCLIFISEYGETQKVTSSLLSLSTGSNPVTIRNIVSSLKKEGILSVRFGTGGTTLSCPLEEITLYRICSALEPDFLNRLIGIHAAPSPLCPVGKNIHGVLDASYAGIRDDLQVSLQSISMKEIMDHYHKRI